MYKSLLNHRFRVISPLKLQALHELQLSETRVAGNKKRSNVYWRYWWILQQDAGSSRTERRWWNIYYGCKNNCSLLCGRPEANQITVIEWVKSFPLSPTTWFQWTRCTLWTRWPWGNRNSKGESPNVLQIFWVHHFVVYASKAAGRLFLLNNYDYSRPHLEHYELKNAYSVLLSRSMVPPELLSCVYEKAKEDPIVLIYHLLPVIFTSFLAKL